MLLGLVGLSLVSQAVSLHAVQERHPVDSARLNGARKHAKNAPAPGNLKNSYRSVLDNEQGMMYTGNFTLGRQHMRGIFDTGSTEFVVFSTKCGSSCGEQRPLWDAEDSKTYHKGNWQQEFEYGSGDLTAHNAYDNFELGSLSADSTAFWEVMHANMDLLKQTNGQAIIGLGPQPNGMQLMDVNTESENSEKYATALGALGIQNFSICYGADEGSAGYIQWNDDSDSFVPEAFTQVPLTQDEGFWLAELTDTGIGNQSFNCSGWDMAKCGAIMDSGTSLIAVPPEVKYAMDMFVKTISNDCGRVHELPPLKFSIAGVALELPSESYVSLVYNNPPEYLHGIFNPDHSECQVSVMEVQLTTPLGPSWILGMPFFRKYYTNFVQPSPSLPQTSLSVALADADCRPTSEAAAADERRRPAQPLNAAKLQMPMWAVEAARTGKVLGTSSPRTII